MDAFIQIFYSIIGWFDQLDKSIILEINSHYNDYFDVFMMWVSDKWIWVPMYCSILYVIAKTKKIETVMVVLGVVFTVVLCDQVSASIFKPIFHRFRPAQDPEIGQLCHVVCGYGNSLYGFVSSHAANTFGVAVFLTLVFRNKLFELFIFFWALINCYSRMYLAAHYLGDIVCGAILGVLLGWLSYWIYKKLVLLLPQFHYIQHKNNSRANVDFPTKEILPFFWTYIVTFAFIALSSTKHIIFC
ncbi:MAG: phosphatase PAP2 family protein [Paludibacteraceae bacterium]|nr:phosphatase PAP2 family protein [Paludibacteraceae bacterium]